jgi:hypothetical protein
MGHIPQHEVSCIVETNTEVGPSRGQSSVSHLAEDVAAQGPAEHGAFAQSLVLTGSILQTVSVVSVVSSFQPRVMDETASESTCAELCALPILRMFTFWVQLAGVGEIVDTRKARIT